MTIESLIKEAAETNPEFRKKWLYWVVQRNKQPDFDWLMGNLEEALGVEYVREQAKKYIESTKESTDN